MIIIKTYCECGEEIKSDVVIGRQRHVELNGDILYTGMTFFTPMNCPKCGKNLGYIGMRKPEVHKCYKQRESYSGGN